MATQLLFYSSAVPLSVQRHRNWAVEPGSDFSFARKTNSVPVMVIEFMKAAAEYSIVFAGDSEKVMPAAILGVQTDANLYVDKDGKWSSKYVPAFVRRYPFVFSIGDDVKTFTVCSDEDYPRVNKEAGGNRWFDDNGELTKYLEGVLNFLKEYQTEHNRTQLFCKKLRELDLLEPMQAQIKLNTGKQVSLTGFKCVSREKLNALAPEKLADLAKSGALELIYVHLYSMKNFTEMMERLSKTLGKEDKSLVAAEPAGHA